MILSLTSIHAFSSELNIKIYEDEKVYCVRLAPYKDHQIGTRDSLAISCVSKASINKDILEVEVLQLQKEKLKKDLKPHKFGK